MSKSILTSVKKLLGVAEECTNFDPDIVMYLNSVFLVLTQMGVRPKEGFFITGAEETWGQFLTDPVKAAAVKAYAAVKVRQLVVLVPCLWLLIRTMGIDRAWFSFWVSEVIACAYSLWATKKELRNKAK